MHERLPFGLCCGSLVQADFRGLVEAASGAGFSAISLWPTLYQGALDGGLSVRDMRALLQDHDLHVSELDPYCQWLPLEVDPHDMAAAFQAYSDDDFYRIADALGALTLNIIQLREAPVNAAQRAETIHHLCDRAARHGLKVSFEFLPWSPVPSLQQALQLVSEVDHPNFGVNIDTWHHFRSGGNIAELESLDPCRVVAVQLNDIAEQPWDNLMEETSMGRLPPGEGCSDTVTVLHALRRAGVNAPINVEVFSADLMALPANEAARRLADSTRAVLAQLLSD